MLTAPITRTVSTTVKVDDERFDIKEDDEGGLWLILKAGNGNALDHEDEEEEGTIMLTITAKDMAVGCRKKHCRRRW